MHCYAITKEELLAQKKFPMTLVPSLAALNELCARELADLIKRRRRPGGDWLVGQVTPNVFGQRRRGCIAPFPVLFERFGDDGLDVATVDPVDGAERVGFVFGDRAGHLRD